MREREVGGGGGEIFNFFKGLHFTALIQLHNTKAISK